MKARLVLAGLLVSLGVPCAAFPGDVAVIVNKTNAVNEISFADLVKMFKQERQLWPDGKKIYLIMREAGSVEKQVVLKEIYQMGEEELKKFWLGKLFREEISSFPKTLRSNEAVKRFVSTVPNAIGVIDASLADETIKTLRIDGKLPGESGYALDQGS